MFGKFSNEHLFISPDFCLFHVSVSKRHTRLIKIYLEITPHMNIRTGYYLKRTVIFSVISYL